jgi:hypothetical protein
VDTGGGVGGRGVAPGTALTLSPSAARS